MSLHNNTKNELYLAYNFLVAIYILLCYCYFNRRYTIHTKTTHETEICFMLRRPEDRGPTSITLHPQG